MKTKYVKPEAVVLAAQLHCVLLDGSGQIEEGDAKRNDIFDLVEATNNERDNAWPDNYSAWDE